MKTTRKYTWISFLLLAFNIWSCGTRKSNVEKSTDKKTDKTEISASELSSINKVENSSTTIDNSSVSESSEVKKEAVKTEYSKESTSQKSAVENSAKTLKKKTYFENGTLRSETDYSENFSKIESENENLKSKISMQTELITDLKSANTSLQRINDNQKITLAETRNKNLKFQTELIELKKTKSKATESKRSEIAWYILSFGGGMAFIILVLVLWKKYGGGVLDRFKNGKIKI